MPVKRTYKQLENIKDFHLREALKKMTDTLFDHIDLLNGTIEDLNSTRTDVDSLNSSISALSTKVKVLSSPATINIEKKTTSTGGGEPLTELEQQVQDDTGAGFNAAESTGHLTPPFSLTAMNAGKIIGGTMTEYSALMAPAIDQPTRDNNQKELLLRIIWHLLNAGYRAGRQKNPSGAISNDKLCFAVDGVDYAFDVFQGVAYTETIPGRVGLVKPADLQIDGGISD